MHLLGLAVTAIGLTVIAAPVAAESQPSATEAQTGGPMTPEPNYEEVIANEYAAAKSKGPRGLIRFIARHGDHALADEARATLQEQAANNADAGPPSSDPDADIYDALYGAMQENTETAYDDFIERYQPHPLVEEAERLRRTAQ